MKKRNGFNRKRRIASIGSWDANEKEERALTAKYGGNSEHKKSPSDYGLIPPANPRPGKTLCDGEKPLFKAEAERLLASGFRKGMISEQMRDGWPQNVWAVSDDGQVYEAQLENGVQGIYHGYPIPMNDDFRSVVVGEWSRR
jgi:hypothetical protein